MKLANSYRLKEILTPYYTEYIFSGYYAHAYQKTVLILHEHFTRT